MQIRAGCGRFSTFPTQQEYHQPHSWQCPHHADGIEQRPPERPCHHPGHGANRMDRQVRHRRQQRVLRRRELPRAQRRQERQECGVGKALGERLHVVTVAYSTWRAGRATAIAGRTSPSPPSAPSRLPAKHAPRRSARTSQPPSVMPASVPPSENGPVAAIAALSKVQMAIERCGHDPGHGLAQLEQRQRMRAPAAPRAASGSDRTGSTTASRNAGRAGTGAAGLLPPAPPRSPSKPADDQRQPSPSSAT